MGGEVAGEEEQGGEPLWARLLLPDTVLDGGAADGRSFVLAGERHDGIVKVGGHRVALAAVEACIAVHPEVQACAVRLHRLPSGAEAGLKALVVRRRKAAAAATVPAVAVDAAGEHDDGDWLDALERFVAARLPAASVPAHWRLADTLPTSAATGKLVDWPLEPADAPT